MKILNRYLSQQFLKNFILVSSTLSGIYFLVDFFERLDNFLGAGQSLGLALKYFLLKIPFMMDMMQPISILLAGILTLGLLNHNHELMALKAGGISIKRITAPILAAALICTIIALSMAQWLLPATEAATDRIWYEKVEHRIPKGIMRNGRVYHRGKRGIYTFIRSSRRPGEFTSFSYTQLNDKDFHFEMMISAARARWQNGIWHFKDGQIKRPAAQGDHLYRVKIFKKMTLSLPDDPRQFFKPFYKAREQSISSLLRQTRSASDSRGAWLNFNKRLSFIFLGLPLICIGLPILLIIHQRWSQDLTVAVPISCGLAFAAWSWWSAAQSMAGAGYIHPVIASWLMYIIVCPFGLWLLARQDR